MRKALLASLVAVSGAAALGGCGVELLTTTAITGELQSQNMQAINRNLERATDSTARVNLQRAIDLFSAEKGRLPKSLDELVPAYLQNIPTKPDGSPFGYEPGTGKLLDGPVPAPAVAAGPTPGDMQKMEQIRAAVNGYGTAVGYYPPSLAALVPAYLAAVPKTDSGEDFIFRCEDGALLHPAQARAQQQAQAAPAPPQTQASRPGMGGGVTPMGEVMTGIGIQNQLNSMSNAGVSAAGTRMRQGAGDVAGQHSQQQERVMDNLGL